MELENLAIKVARSDNLPVLPQIVSSVLKVVDDPHASGRTLELIIEKDPGIAAKLLKAANSAIYGTNRVPTIGRAMSVLGLNGVKCLVVNIAFQQIATGRTCSANFNKLSYWRHSLAVATGSRIFGKLLLPLKAEELYVAGMLHDVGMLALDRFCPDEFDASIKLAQAQNLCLYQAEQIVMGFDHTAVGELLAQKWGLPDLIVSAIRHHHDINADTEHLTTTCIVAQAEALAHQFGFNNNSPVGKYEFDAEAASTLNLPEEQFPVIGKVMHDEVMRTQTAFNIAA